MGDGGIEGRSMEVGGAGEEQVVVRLKREQRSPFSECLDQEYRGQAPGCRHCTRGCTATAHESTEFAMASV